jgi:predicted enzyme related to lactoylglutathione lyase
MSERNEYAPGEFCWVDLTSHDLQAAQQWYGKLFGWDAKLEDTKGGPPYAQFISKGKAVAGLGQMSDEMKKQGIPPTWNSYVNVTDCAAAEKKAKELGATITVPTMQVVDAGKLCFIVDPQGAHVAFWQKLSHIGAGRVNEPGAFSWNELATRDLSGSKKFYSGLFGWKLDTQDMGGGMKYTMIENSSRPNGGVIEMDAKWEGIPPHWMVYFWVDDVDASAKKVAESGGKISVPPTDIPPGRFSVVNDPQGAVFTLFKGNQVM